MQPAGHLMAETEIRDVWHGYAVLNLVPRYRSVHVSDEHQNKYKYRRTSRYGVLAGRLAEACSARERPGRGGRWCGNDRTLTCEVVLWVGHKAAKPPNNIRYSYGRTIRPCVYTIVS
jgi:hypothetical protein